MTNESEGQVPQGAAVLPEIPAELGVNPLLLAVLHSVIFLDGSTEEVVHPGAASETLEYLATYLQRLRGESLQKAREDLEVLAGYAREEDWGKPMVRFFKDFLASFGAAEEDQE